MFSPQLALLLCSAGAPSTTALPPIAIVGANVIRPAGEGVIRNATVVMRAGRFEAVGPRDRTPIPSGAHVIDGAGKWIIPGLIDMHVHLDEVLTPGAFTLFGVTTVRDVGSGRETIDALRKRAADGEPVPRICWMGRNIDEGRPSWWGAVAVKGPAEVPRLISDMQAQGVSGVKLYVFARTDVTRAVIAEAHKRGLPVTAHLGLTTPSEAARAGIDNIEHVTTLFHELRDRQKHIRPGYFDAFAGASQVSLGGARARRLLAILAHHHVAVTATLCAGLLPVEGESGAAAVYHGWADVPDGWRRYWRMPYWDFISAKGWTRAELRADCPPTSACAEPRRMPPVFYTEAATLARSGQAIALTAFSWRPIHSTIYATCAGYVRYTGTEGASTEPNCGMISAMRGPMT